MNNETLNGHIVGERPLKRPSMQFPVESQLRDAVKRNDIQFIIDLLDNIDNDKLDQDAVSRAYSDGCKAGSVEVVAILLARFSLHSSLDQGLLSAASHGNLEVVKFLIFKGANVFSGFDGSLRMACVNGEVAIVSYLLPKYFRRGRTLKSRIKSFFNHNLAISSRLSNALQTAIINHQIDVVKVMVEQGVNIHYKNEQALQTAVSNGDLDIVQYLIEKGACMHTGKPNAYNLAMSGGHDDVGSFMRTINLKNAKLQDDPPHDRSRSIKRGVL